MNTVRIVSFVAFHLLVQAAGAQVPVTDSCPADAPVALQVATIMPRAEHANVTITNKNPKPFSAVVLRWKLTDSSGTAISEVSMVDIATTGTLVPSGQSVTTEASVSVGEGRSLRAAEVTCAAVLFSGKGLWGDKNMPEIVRLKGIRAGVKSERSRLLKLYQSEGQDKLIQELKRPVAQ
jgi:hypothetical protein